MLGRRLGRSAFLGAIAAVWALAAAAYGYVWFADPYELRFGRDTARLADHPYPPEIVPRLVSVAAHGDADLVVIGASTSMGYTPAMLGRVFPMARRPVNLSFPCADVDDLRRILPILEQSHDVRRVIVSLDTTLLYNCALPRGQSPLDPRYYRHEWYDPAPEFSGEALALSWSEQRTGVVDMPDWRPRLADRVEGITDGPPMTTAKDEVRTLSQQVEQARGIVTAGADLPCAAVPAVTTVIAPFVRRMAARGVAVDLVTPPYSLGIYSVWAVSPGGFPSSPFVSIMALQRCALQATAGLPNVRFHALGADPSVVTNLSLYRDPAHIADYRAYEALLHRIAAGDAAIAPAQWPAYEARLKREVGAYRIG